MRLVWSTIESALGTLCAAEGRPGVMAAVPLSEVRLLPEQAEYLRAKVSSLGRSEGEITAVVMGMAYHRAEVEAIPTQWITQDIPRDRWNEYAHAYTNLNRALNRVSSALALQFGGVAEGATLEGMVDQVTHVREYFPACVSHRAVAEAAGLGWRGKHGLIVTPEFGPAFRMATVFMPAPLQGPKRELAGCGECQACLDTCPVLRRGMVKADLNVYREGCRLHLQKLALDDEVCGICVRRCWEIIAPTGTPS